MLDQHTFTLDRPRFDNTRAYYQARCACGWRAAPTYTLPRQRQAARTHLAVEWDAALKADWWAAAERGEPFSPEAWTALHPMPREPRLDQGR